MVDYKYQQRQSIRKETKMHNPHAAALASKLFSKKIVRAKKGKGSYSRKGR